MRYYDRNFVFGIALLGALSCAKAENAIDPVWGKEPCAHCSMIVGDKRFAAQVGTDGERKYFDDIGCMVSWLGEHKAERTWVRVDGKWVDAKSARYVTGAKTPMDFGFEAKAEGGVGWDEMRDQIAKRSAK